MRRFELAFLAIAALATAQCGHPSDSLDDPTSAPAPASDVPAAVRVPIDGLPVFGNRDAPVTVVFFTDYECPYCARADASISKLRAELGDDVRVAVAMHPLPMHEHADVAARALIAAAQEGRAEAMHTRLFEKHGVIDDADVAGLDLNSDRVTATLRAQQDLASTLGVEGTPSFFINGRRIVGAQPYEQFRALALEERTKAKTLGVPASKVYAKLMAAAPAATAHAVEQDEIVDVAVSGAPVRGHSAAPVTIALFSDFECPYCVKAEATLRTLEDAYPGKVKVAFRHRPLPMHEHARLAAKASMAADAQGRFWEYHDILLQHRDALERSQLESYALQAGLDARRFARDLDGAELDARLDADLDQAARLGVKGTPTMFVNGRRITGAQPLEVFRSAVNRALR